MSDADAVREAVAPAPPKSDGAQLARDLVQALTREEEAERALRGAVSTGDEHMMADRARGYVSARRDVGRIGSEVAGVAGNPTAVPEPEHRAGRAAPPADPVAAAQDAAEEGQPKPAFSRGQEVTIEVDGEHLVGTVTSYRPDGETFLYVVRDDGNQMLTEQPVPEARVSANAAPPAETGAEEVTPPAAA